MKGIMIIGTDTGVGKTTICAGILKLLHGSRKLAYWKPVQTGTIVGNDPKEVMQLSGLPPECFIETNYRFPEPLAPHQAAKKWGKTIDLNVLLTTLNQHLKAGTFLVIEGAGGVFSPFNEKELQIDFMKKTGLNVLLIGQDRVGQVNQTLLTLDALRDAKIDIEGVILTKMRGTFGNAESIEHFGKVKVIAQFADSQNKATLVGEVGGNDNLRTLFKVPKLP